MGTKENRREIQFMEFVLIISLMISIGAVTTDAMLPALSKIGEDINVQDSNGQQLVVSSMFLGLSVGQ